MLTKTLDRLSQNIHTVKHVFNVCIKSPKVVSVLLLHNRRVSESTLFSSIIVTITVLIVYAEFQVALHALKED